MADNGQRAAMARTMNRTPSPEGMARDGAPKRLTDPAIAPGMKRATSGGLHPYLHGQAVNDKALEKSWSGKGNVPVHPGMTSKQKASVHPIANDGNAILQEAATLGPK